MSNQNDENDYGELAKAIEFFFEQRLKDLWTAVPGMVVKYDAPTKRASVQVAIQRLMTDGSLQEPVIITNVPVIHPSGGGFSLLFPLAKDDPVLLVFARRGLSEFKKAFAKSPPDVGSVMDLAGAVAIAGFGKIEVTPASEGGVAMQTESGDNFVAVEDGAVKITTTGDVTVEATGKAVVNAQVVELAGAEFDVATTGNPCAFAGLIPVGSTKVKAGA